VRAEVEKAALRIAMTLVAGVVNRLMMMADILVVCVSE
jgi:hypothetical protein